MNSFCCTDLQCSYKNLNVNQNMFNADSGLLVQSVCIYILLFFILFQNIPLLNYLLSVVQVLHGQPRVALSQTLPRKATVGQGELQAGGRQKWWWGGVIWQNTILDHSKIKGWQGQKDTRGLVNKNKLQRHWIATIKHYKNYSKEMIPSSFI